ncbi:MAG: TM2 domain-containing protein [Owenweeksia sp.]|nr:TM2 domain-containing protein [Owenweeksia sp.]
MEQRIFSMIPGMDHQEYQILENLLKELSEDKQQTFMSIYAGKRRNPDHILIGSLIGLVLVAGVQRFMINQIGMGILYLLTAGLCFIGTIVDCVNYKKLALEYNQQQAYEALQMTKSLS